MTPLRTCFVPLLMTLLSAGLAAQGQLRPATGQDREPQVKQDKQQKGWLGILLGPNEDGEGVMVTEVLPKSPAERAGLKADDVIRKVDGSEVPSVEKFVEVIGSKSPGAEVAIGLERGGQAKTIEVKLAARPSEQEVAAITRGEGRGEKADAELREKPAPMEETREAKGAERGYLGITVQADEDQAVVISKVAEGSPAAKAGLAGGDRLLTINRTKVDGWEALDQTMQSKKRGEKLSITVSRGGKEMALVATLSGRPEDSASGEKAEKAPKPEKVVSAAKSEKSSGKAAWLESYDKALAAAKETGKPIVIKFEADWCEPCRKLTEEVGKPEVVAALAAFVPLVIDTDEQKDVADKFGVSGLPHVLALRSDGSRIGEFSGWQPAEVVVQKLAEWSKGARATKKETPSARAMAPESEEPRREPARMRRTAAGEGDLDSEVKQMRSELSEIRKVLEKILERMDKN